MGCRSESATLRGGDPTSRALFIGSQGVHCAGALRGWLDAGNEVAAVWTGGRVKKPAPGEWLGAGDWNINRLTTRHRIPLTQVPRLRGWSGAEAAIGALGVDTLITCGTMFIVPEPLIALFGGRAANLHPALLPDYRGPTPLLSMLLDGAADRCGGVTLHMLTAGIDEGPVIAQRRLPFEQAGRSYQTWLAQQAGACCTLMRDAMPAYLDGRIAVKSQVGGSYRKVVADALVGPETEFRAVEHVLQVVGQSRNIPAAFAGRERPVLVKSIKERIGPPTGAPAKLGALTLTLDLKDARVTLNRFTSIDRVGDRLRLIAALRRLDQE